MSERLFKYWNDNLTESQVTTLERYIGECEEPNLYDIFSKKTYELQTGNKVEKKEPLYHFDQLEDDEEATEFDDVVDLSNFVDYPNGSVLIPPFKGMGRFRGYYRIKSDGTIFKNEQKLQKKTKYSEFYRNAPLEFGVDEKTGRLTVMLQSHQEDQPRVHFVDELVASAFIRRPVNKTEYIIHKNGDVTDNSASNLEWSNYIYESRKLWWFTLIGRNKDWELPKELYKDQFFLSCGNLAKGYAESKSIVPQLGSMAAKKKPIKIEFISAFDAYTHEPLKLFTSIDDAVLWLMERCNVSIDGTDQESLETKRWYHDIIRVSMSSLTVAGVRYTLGQYMKAKRMMKHLSKSAEQRYEELYKGINMKLLSNIVDIKKGTLNPNEVAALTPKVFNGVAFSIFIPVRKPGEKSVDLSDSILIYNKLFDGSRIYNNY